MTHTYIYIHTQDYDMQEPIQSQELYKDKFQEDFGKDSYLTYQSDPQR